jgi:hypothetical protein
MRFFAPVLIFILFSCNQSNENNDGETGQAEVADIGDGAAKDSLFARSAAVHDLISHPKHEEDKSYPWFDTRCAGSWMNESYRNKLVEIFERDTTLSLYEYVKGLDQCDGELLAVEIEGCAKDKIFYLKNSACDDRYIAKSDFELDKKIDFTLKNVYSGVSYAFNNPEYGELSIDGKKFVKNWYRAVELDQILEGVYVVYDHQDHLIDTVNLRNQRFENSDTLSGMDLLSLTYVNSNFRLKPTLPHSDLVLVGFYTGDSVEVELEDAGTFETVAKLKHIQFDLKRVSNGFELHNACEDERVGVFRHGLVYRFRKIAAFKRKQRKIS